MLIALIVLVVIDLVLTFVVFCGQRALWARLSEPTVVNNTVGEVLKGFERPAATFHAEQPVR